MIYDQNQLSRVKWGDMSLEGGREELSDRLVWRMPKFTDESTVV